jgi:hypothetical protein
MKEKTAEEHFSQGNVELAFELFKLRAEDETIEPGIRSDAFNMMGVLVNSYLPGDGFKDITGYSLFVRAIELNPDNAGALCNLVMTYGEGDFEHLNKTTAIWACERVLNGKFGPPIETELLNEIREIYNRLLA